MNPLPWMHHLIIVPVLLPLLVGALLIPVNQKRHARKFAFSVASGAESSRTPERMEGRPSRRGQRTPVTTS